MSHRYTDHASDWDARMNYAFRQPDPRKRRGVDPISIGALLTSFVIEGQLALGLGALSVSTFNAVTTALTSVIGFGAFAGASALASGLAGGRSAQIRSPDAQKRSYELEDGPRIIVLGRARVGGVFALRGSTGFDTYRLLAQCQGPVDGIEEYFLADKAVTVDFDGAVSSPPYASTSGSYLHLYSKLGAADQTAFSQLTSAFPDNWSSDHRGRGVLHTLAKFTSPGTDNPAFLQVWPEGYQQFDTLVRGVSVYDPRLDSTTASGAGDQRSDDPSTWAWSDNGVLCALWHCTAPEDDGGFGLSFDKFDLDDVAEQADLADAAVDSKAGAGAERRSVCSGSYTTDTPRGDVLANILLSTGVRQVRLQNKKMSFRLEEDNPTPTATIARENILGVDFGGDEVLTEVNQLSLMFISPERNWQMAELAIHDRAWARDADSIASTGKRTETLSLKFCPQPGQAQRIARRVFAKRRAPRGAVTTNCAGIVTIGHIAGTVELDVLEPDYHPVVEFGSHRMDQERKSVEIPLIFLPVLSEWSVDDDEVAAPTALEDIQFSGDLAAPVLSSVKLAKIGAGSTDNKLRAKYSAVSGATGYEATYRTWDGSTSGARTGMTEKTGEWADSASGIAVGARYLLQVRAFDGDGNVSNWSNTVEHEGPFDTTAPTNCTATGGVDGGGPDVGAVSIRCNDINISRIQLDAETPFYAEPFQTYNFLRANNSSTNARFFNSTGEYTDVAIVWS